jgi:hypothetical protein
MINIKLGENAPVGYTGLAMRAVDSVFVYVDGAIQYVNLDTSHNRPIWWYHKSYFSTTSSHTFKAMFPKTWELFKDHPVLGPALAAYALGKDHD